MQDANTAPQQPHQARLSPIADTERCLDTHQLHDLEQSFRGWAESAIRPDHRRSRQRILVIFLLIRYTGARLNEIAGLDLANDFDPAHNLVRLGRKKSAGNEANYREVQIPEAVTADIRAITLDLDISGEGDSPFRVDPAHIRRKFYERAAAMGIPPSLGTPETIRKSRAVELMQSNMPLPVIQKLLGHSTPNLAASYVEFSDADIRRVAKFFADRENLRKTSARNSFFCKISAIQEGEIQSVVEAVSAGGNLITSIITTNSLRRLGLKPGMLVTAEVKAPWIELYKGESPPNCSAENMFEGTVRQIAHNRTTAEIAVHLEDGTELCAIITEKSRRRMAIEKQDVLWVYFDAFAVVLHVD